MTTDEAIRAYVAASKLRSLYGAYRATSWANVIVLERIAGRLDLESPGALDKLEQLRSSATLSRQTDLAYAKRSEDLRQRLIRLRQEHEIP